VILIALEAAPIETRLPLYLASSALTICSEVLNLVTAESFRCYFLQTNPSDTLPPLRPFILLFFLLTPRSADAAYSCSFGKASIPNSLIYVGSTDHAFHPLIHELVIDSFQQRGTERGRRGNDTPHGANGSFLAFFYTLTY